MSERPGRVLVAFVDALGPDQLARFGAGLHSFPYRRALGGVLGYSSGALATILTGALPVQHGRMCLFAGRRSDESGILEPLRWLGLLPRIVHERPAIRRWLARALAKRAGLTGYVALHRVPPDAFRWLDLPEREDLFSAETVGEAHTFLADARAAGLSVYAAPWQLPETSRWEHVHTALARHQPDLAFLYCAELDATLHRGGNDDVEAGLVIDRIAAHIERARDAMARGSGHLTSLVVGDHGMADVHTFVDPRPLIARLSNVHAFVDSTMLRFWGEERALDEARHVVEMANVEGQWLTAAALEQRAVPVAGSPYGRAMFLLSEGAIFAPSFVGGRVRGMHGYDLPTTSAAAGLASDAPLPEKCDSIASVAGIVRARLGLSG